MAKEEAPPNSGRTLTVQEAADELRIGINQAYEYVRSGKIPSIKLGRRKYLIPRAAFDRMLAGE